MGKAIRYHCFYERFVAQLKITVKLRSYNILFKHTVHNSRIHNKAIPVKRQQDEQQATRFLAGQSQEWSGMLAGNGAYIAHKIFNRNCFKYQILKYLNQNPKMSILLYIVK